MKDSKHIHCVEDGKTFLGIKNAADYYGVSTAAISKAVVHGKTVKGFHLAKGWSKYFREDIENQRFNIYDKAFNAWYEGKQPIDEKMIHLLAAWGIIREQEDFEKSRKAVAIRFRRECDKRGLQTPKKSRFKYKIKSKIDSKYGLQTWEKAYNLWVDYGWTLEDIADDLGISIATVHRRLKQWKGD